jgi:hypothetical protein
MGGFFRSPSPPPPPPPPPPLPVAPKATDKGQMAARSAQKKRAGSKTGIAGTTATSGQGILTDASTTEPTLLGS